MYMQLEWYSAFFTQTWRMLLFDLIDYKFDQIPANLTILLTILKCVKEPTLLGSGLEQGLS